MLTENGAKTAVQQDFLLKLNLFNEIIGKYKSSSFDIKVKYQIYTL